MKLIAPDPRLKMRVGVFLNHYEPHQVPHVAPFAFALSIVRPSWHVAIRCSTEAEEVFSRDIAELYPSHNCQIERLDVLVFAKVIDPLMHQIVFYRKRAVQKANMNLLATYDALIVPEYTSLSLKDDRRTSKMKLIFTGHGAGDNPWVGNFDERIADFDLVLLPGRRILDGLNALNRLKHAPYAVTGYPKFELSGLVGKSHFLLKNAQ